jgi:hypothetical protein
VFSPLCLPFFLNISTGNSLGNAYHHETDVVLKYMWKHFSACQRGEWTYAGNILPHATQYDMSSCGVYALNTLKAAVLGAPISQEVGRPIVQRFAWFAELAERQLKQAQADFDRTALDTGSRVLLAVNAPPEDEGNSDLIGTGSELQQLAKINNAGDFTQAELPLDAGSIATSMELQQIQNTSTSDLMSAEPLLDDDTSLAFSVPCPSSPVPSSPPASSIISVNMSTISQSSDSHMRQPRMSSPLSLKRSIQTGVKRVRKWFTSDEEDPDCTSSDSLASSSHSRPAYTSAPGESKLAKRCQQKVARQQDGSLFSEPGHAERYQRYQEAACVEDNRCKFASS